MEHIKNYGILASIAWNSNEWKADPTDTDLKKSKYDFVKENQHTHESINFGHELYPHEANGTFIGYTPMLRRLPDVEKAKNVCVVFLLSSDYQHQNRKCIVGLYGFPDIGWFEREAEHPMYNKYDAGNLRSRVDDIIYFQYPVVIDDERVVQRKLLPPGKLISKMGFNYLDSDNVLKILQLAAGLNPNNTKLANLLKRFPEDLSSVNELIDTEDFQEFIGNHDADSVESLGRLEKKMQKLRPQVKERVSSFIERGAIARKVKVLTKHKCLACEAMGMNPIGFRKPDGTPYVETHHVEPVSQLSVGSLGLTNLITLCANHHRQMHYGNAKLTQQTKTHFTFILDGQELVILKVALKAMPTEKDRERRKIFYNIQVGPDDNPRWRHWGYSVELGPLDHRLSTACDFCKTESGKFFKTTCHCGSAHVGGVTMNKLKMSASYSPETGDFDFFCCEQCIDKIEALVPYQSSELLNHEILIKVIRTIHCELSV